MRDTVAGWYWIRKALVGLVGFVVSMVVAPGAAVAELAETSVCEGTDEPADVQDCRVVDGNLVVERADETDLTNLDELRRVTGSLKIRHSPQIRQLAPLQQLRHVGGDVHLVTLPQLRSLDGLDGLESVGGQLHFVDLNVPSCRIQQVVDQLPSDTERQLTMLSLPADPDDCSTFEPEVASGDQQLPVDRLPQLEEMRGGELLEGVHPELVDRIRLMYALLEREDIEIVFISGFRPHEHFYDAENRYASWHNLGLAVDLNLAHRNSMQDAEAHFEEDERKWRRIEEIASGLGIIWGEYFDDIFHFEWHPGYHARIRTHEYEQFQRLAGPNLEDYREVWSLFEDGSAEDDAGNCPGGCHVIPDDGLRDLLEQLR